MVAEGFVVDGALRAGRGARRPGAAARAPGRLVHRVDLRARDAARGRRSGCRRRTPSTGSRCRAARRCARRCSCRSCSRPSSSASPSASCWGRAARSASSASTARRSRSSAGWSSSTSPSWSAPSGSAWESLDPRPGQAAAALGASPWQVLRTVTLPALRPAIVGCGQHRLPLLRDRLRHRAHPRRGPLRDGRDRDLPAHHHGLRPAGRGRAVGAADRGRRRPARPRPRGCGRPPTRRPSAS